MAGWTDEIAKLDRMLHAVGVPDTQRLRHITDVANALIQAEKTRREAETARRKEEEAARLCRLIGATRGAEVMGVKLRTFYWLRARFYSRQNCAMQTLPLLHD
ncbi:MAG TPA: hypothetical protein VFE72_12090 [Lysobacter sp.]|nr:hypothetical protein [Lysobacter sp.]